MKTIASKTNSIIGIRSFISIIFISVFCIFSIHTVNAEINDESSTILIEASTLNEVAYGFVKCDNGISTTEIKKGIVKSARTPRATQFNFEHDENVEINFKLKLNKKGTFKWVAKNTNSAEELSLLGLEKTTGIGNNISFITQNKSNKSKTITIEVTPLYNNEDGQYEGNTEKFIINVYPKVVPTFELAPKEKEADNYAIVKYKTQEKFHNYSWSFSGIEEKDYTIVSGGTNNDHMVSLIWLTEGEKKVEVNYESNIDTKAENPAQIITQVNKIGKELKVGDQYQGGIIFEVFGTPGKQWGTIISKEDICRCAWKNGSADEMDVNEICENFFTNEDDIIIDDWYLPAIFEIKKAYNNIPSHMTSTYWSSSESKRVNNHAIILSENGQIGMATKESVHTSNSVRPVRKFTYKSSKYNNNENANTETLATVK